MKHSWLTEPVSQDAPCGPNLERGDDDAFLDYYFEAEGRLPERYFTPGMLQDEKSGLRTPDRLFDPASITLKTEQRQIGALLKRSRDLRLLCLLARFEILGGSLPGFADALEEIETLLEIFPTAVHPDLETARTERRDALRTLADPVAVLAPLTHLSMTGAAEVTYRAHLVASAQATRRHDEAETDTTSFMRMLSDDGMKTQLGKTQADLGRAAKALASIDAMCKDLPDGALSVDLDPVTTLITSIQGVIQSARPELNVAKPGATPTKAAKAKADAPQTKTNSDAPAAGTLADLPAAYATLTAVERFLLENEPSSAALLLVAQARKLVGKPLIEALEALMPEESKRAVVDLGAKTGFALSMDRLKVLSSDLQSDRPPVKIEGGTAPEIKTRAVLAGHISAVEDYFRRFEPSSPIPVLLERARGYLDKDFQALLSELVPAAPDSS